MVLGSDSKLGRIARHRLTHFAGLAAVLLALAPSTWNREEIPIDAAQLHAIWAVQARRAGVASLSEAEKQETIDAFVRDEMLYREGLRLGMDRYDAIVRARVIQKMLMYAEDVGGASRPLTEDELRRWYDEDPTRWRRPAEASFEHVLSSTRVHGDAAAEHAADIARQLRADPTLDPMQLGDAFGLSRDVPFKDARGVSRQFGDAVAAAVFELPPGEWSDPVASPFGQHVIRVRDRRPGGVRAFEDARKQVRLDRQAERKAAAIEQLIRQLEQQYDVSFEPPSVGTALDPSSAPPPADGAPTP